jgi:hypothetical protein
VAVLEDLQDIAPAVVVQGDEAPVVDKQEVHSGQAGQDFAVTAVDQEAEAFLERQFPEVGHPHLLFPAPGHTPEPQTIELLQSRMG